MAFLSQQKITELQKQLNELQATLLKQNEQDAKQGGPMDSFKEAASFAVVKQAKENKIQEIGRTLAEATLLADYLAGDSVVLGKWFKVRNSHGEQRYRLVDPLEAEPKLGLISSDSPLGQLVQNQKSGFKFMLNNIAFEIIAVE